MLIFFVLAIVVVPAAVVDVRSRRIPNLLSLAGILLGMALNVYFSGFDGVLTASAGMLLAFAIGFPLWLASWLGAGDVKLVAAVGAIVGLKLVLPVLAGIALTGGGLAALHLLARRLQNEPLYVYAMSLFFSGRKSESLPAADTVLELPKKTGMPYAVPVAIGSLATIVYLS